jgi:hypothetical protein
MKRKVSDIRVAKKMMQLYNSAHERGIINTLSFKKVKQLLEKDTCYYTGKLFIPDDSRLERSFERVDNTVGYTDDNVVACLRYINGLKSSFLIEDFMSICKGIEKFTKIQKKKLKLKPKAKIKKIPVNELICINSAV